MLSKIKSSSINRKQVKACDVNDWRFQPAYLNCQSQLKVGSTFNKIQTDIRRDITADNDLRGVSANKLTYRQQSASGNSAYNRASGSMDYQQNASRINNFDQSIRFVVLLLII